MSCHDDHYGEDDDDDDDSSHGWGSRKKDEGRRKREEMKGMNEKKIAQSHEGMKSAFASHTSTIPSHDDVMWHQKMQPDLHHFSSKWLN